MQERNTNHILLYLACDQMVIGVIQLQRKEWGKHFMTTTKMCIRARQLLCMGVKELPIEDLCVGVRHLPLEDICVAVRQTPTSRYGLELENF